jgi:hypothetical protein
LVNAQKQERMIFSIDIRYSRWDAGTVFATAKIPYITADAAPITGYRNDEVE